MITEVVESVPSYQMYDGGFAYWKDSQNSYLPLTLSVVSRLQDLSRLGFVVAPGVLPGASKYIKNTFYTNTRPYCTMTDCSYSFPERLDMIA